MQQQIDFSSALRFNGPEYKPVRDEQRLSSQFWTILDLMSDGCWRTLKEIAEITGYPEASVSAQLRHARKSRFGSHSVEREHVTRGLFRYRVTVNRETTAI